MHDPGTISIIIMPCTESTTAAVDGEASYLGVVDMCSDMLIATMG